MPVIDFEEALRTILSNVQSLSAENVALINYTASLARAFDFRPTDHFYHM
jgi:hypothetical protein